MDNLVDDLKGPLDDYHELTRESAGELHELSLVALGYPTRWSLGTFPGRRVEPVVRVSNLLNSINRVVGIRDLPCQIYYSRIQFRHCSAVVYEEIPDTWKAFHHPDAH